MKFNQAEYALLSRRGSVPRAQGVHSVPDTQLRPDEMQDTRATVRVVRRRRLLAAVVLAARSPSAAPVRQRRRGR